MESFCCVTCGKTHPSTELARKCGGGKNSSECKACAAVATSKSDGTFRHGRHKLGSYARANQKEAVKKYKSGKLPPWMFS